MAPEDWPSLGFQIALSKRLFGSHGKAMLDAWFGLQVERLTDPAFACLFSDHINLPSIASGDYNHRLVQAKNGRLIGGIRFYGGDITRPFVDVIAHDFHDPNELRDCVATEWASFAPRNLRLVLACGTQLPAFAEVDVSIYVSRFGDMTPPDNRVSLVRFQNVDEAVSIVATRYAELARSDPALAQNISAADEADLKFWHDENQVFAIHTEVHGSEKTVGLFAAAPGKVEWIEGDEVNEEVILSAYSGHGFAASAQMAWAARSEADPNTLLVGTIDRLNNASRRSAEKARRIAVLDYAFLSTKG